jgi:hypothetical protein
MQTQHSVWGRTVLSTGIFIHSFIHSCKLNTTRSTKTTSQQTFNRHDQCIVATSGWRQSTVLRKRITYACTDLRRVHGRVCPLLRCSSPNPKLSHGSEQMHLYRCMHLCSSKAKAVSHRVSIPPTHPPPWARPSPPLPALPCSLHSFGSARRSPEARIHRPNHHERGRGYAPSTGRPRA